MASQRKLGAILGYANIIVKNLVNLVYTPMLLAFVGQADYGVFQTSNSFVFSLSLLSFGFSGAYIRFYTQKKAHGTEGDIRALNGMYLSLYIVVCALALGLGLLFAANVETFFSGSFTSEQVGLAGQLMVIMAFSVACTLLSSVFDAYILAHEQFRFQQTRQMFTTLAIPVIALVLLAFGMGAVGVALAQLAVNVVLLMLNIRLAVARLGMRFDLRHFDWALFRGVAAFSAWIFVNQICDLVNQSVPNMLLGALAGAVAVSVFAASVQIRQVFYSLSTAMSSVFVPKITVQPFCIDTVFEERYIERAVYRYRNNSAGITANCIRYKKGLDTFWIVDELLAWCRSLGVPFTSKLFEATLYQMGPLLLSRTAALNARERRALFAAACDLIASIPEFDGLETGMGERWGDVLLALRGRYYLLWRAAASF